MTTVGDLLAEFKEKPKAGQEPPVLTLTERKGFVRQADRFNKRLATDDISGYKIVRRNDIAFNPYLLWAGAVGQNTIVDEGVISPLYPTFRVRDGYDPRYVARMLLTPQLIRAYDSIAFGSVPRRRRSSVKDFLSLSVANIPPIEEQRRIAGILDQADAICSMRRRVLTQLDSLTQSIFHDMFSKSAEMDQVQLGEIADVASGITKGRRTSIPTMITPYLAVVNVQAGYLNLDKVKEIEATHAEIDRYALRDGDLILTEGGDPDKLGRGTVWRGQIPLCLHQNHIFRVRLNTRSVISDYLEHYTASRVARSYFLRSAKQTTGIASINKTQLNALPVAVPPVALQREFADRSARVDAQRATVQQALNADSELFASLQDRAFRGEL